MAGTDSKNDTWLTRGGSGGVRYEIVSKEGDIFGPFKTAPEAADWAKKRWPDQEQRGENGTDGWDLRVEGVD